MCIVCPTNINGNICSASYLRKKIESDENDIFGLMPPECGELLKEHVKDNAPVYFNDYSDVFFESLRKHESDGLSNYFDVYDDLSDKLLNPLYEFKNADDYCHLVKTREVALAHIKRALVHIALDYTKDDVDYAVSENYYLYSRLLGFRKEKKEILSLIGGNGHKMISKTSDFDKVLSGRALSIYRKDISASMLYQYIKQKKDKKPVINEFTRSVIIL